MPVSRWLLAVGAAALVLVAWWAVREAPVREPPPTRASPAGCPPAPAPPAASVPTAPPPAIPHRLEPVVVDRYPHDPTAFTQGLAYAGAGELYEGTGLEGQSQARRVDLETGRPVAAVDLPSDQFGEGLTLAGSRLVQLTWQDGVGYVRDRCSLAELARFTYEGEGWGLAAGDDLVWRSDGTDVLRGLDPRTFEVRRELRVRDRGVPVLRLNELEVVDGQLLANVWQTDWIARIDLSSGRVTGWVDASALSAELAGELDLDAGAVLNGIAADASTDRLWLTGKLWPVLFEVRLQPAAGPLPPPGLGLGG